MKLMSFRAGDTAAWGVVEGDTVVDCTSLAPSLRAALAGGFKPGSLAGLARIPLDQVTFLPPVTDPDKIICIGLNYLTHILEGGREPPKKPTIFTRFANSQVGHLQPIIRPNASITLDFEGELAVIIGRPARHVTRDAAMGHIAGYSCYNDGSVREWQRHSSQFTPGKISRRPAASAPGLSRPTKPGTSPMPASSPASTARRCSAPPPMTWSSISPP